MNPIKKWLRKREIRNNGKYIKITKGGQLYITLEDFFNRPAFKKQLKELEESELTKSIRTRTHHTTGETQ